MDSVFCLSYRLVTNEKTGYGIFESLFFRPGRPRPCPEDRRFPNSKEKS